MRGALVIFAAMIVIGIVLYLIDIFYYRRKHPATDTSVKKDDAISSNSASQTSVNSRVQTGSVSVTATGAAVNQESEGICCGMHTVCEKTNLSPLTGEVVYYDDEELDRFRGREPESYTAEETEEFRDVLMTLLPEDVAGWSRSIQVREIALPVEVRDELLLIVSELRQGNS